jgi:hypothetical protein
VLTETPLPIPLPRKEPHPYIIFTPITEHQQSRQPGQRLNQKQIVELSHRSATLPWCLETITGYLFESSTHHTKTYVTQQPWQIADDSGSGSRSGSDRRRMLTNIRHKEKAMRTKGSSLRPEFTHVCLLALTQDPYPDRGNNVHFTPSRRPRNQIYRPSIDYENGLGSYYSVRPPLHVSVTAKSCTGQSRTKTI